MTDLLEAGWGDIVDPLERVDDINDFYGLGAGSRGFTTLDDRADGKYLPFFRHEIDLARIRASCRNLAVIDGVAIGAIESLANYIFGKTGIRFTVQGETSTDLVAAAQSSIDRFLDQNEFQGELDREIHLRSREDGEAFVQLEMTPGGVLAELLEPDQIRQPANSSQLNEWLLDQFEIDCDAFVPSWSFGILTPANRCNRVLGYHVVRDMSGRDWDFLPASRIEHFKRNTPQSVKRGLGDLYPVLEDMRNEANLSRNMVLGASLQAAIGWIEESPAGTTESQAKALAALHAESTIQRPRKDGGQAKINKTRYRPGTILRPSPGLVYKSGPMGAERNQGFLTVAKYIMRRIGVRWTIPESLISGDASNANLACHDTETELLTKRGWLKHGAIRYGDVAGTMNPLTEEFEWQEIEAIHIHDYDGPMVWLKGRHNLDALVTPNHRMFVSQIQHRRPGGRRGKLIRAGRKPFDFVAADELKLGSIVPLACKPKRGIPIETFEIPGVQTTHINPKTRRPQPRALPAKSMPMMAFLRFLGWWISEGWTVAQSKSHHGHTIGVSQTVRFTEECDDINANLSKLPCHFGSWIIKNGTIREWCINDKSLWTWLRRYCGLGSYTKRIPDFLHDLPAVQQRELLGALLLGDGSHRQGGSATYFTVSTKLADEFQSLAIQCGYISHRMKMMNNGVIPVCGKRTDRHIKIRAKHISHVPYIGKVWCVTVPNGLIVTRRNGKSIVTGNSSLVAEAPFVHAREADQQWFGRRFISMLWKVLRLEFEVGRFDSFVSGWAEFMGQLDLVADYPAVATRDKLQQAQVHETYVRMGVLSKATAATEAGYDLDVETEKGATSAEDAAVKAQQVKDEREYDLARQSLDLSSAASSAPVVSSPVVSDSSVQAASGPVVSENQNVAALSLNGTQIDGLLSIMAQVTTGVLPMETAKATIRVSFPAISTTQIEEIFSPLVGFSPRPQLPTGIAESSAILSEAIESARTTNEARSILSQIRSPPGQASLSAAIVASLGSVRSEQEANAIIEAMSVKFGRIKHDAERIVEAFDPSQPRDDQGQWVDTGALKAAITDPSKALALRARVTNPKERAKLDRLIGIDPRKVKSRSVKVGTTLTSVVRDKSGKLRMADGSVVPPHIEKLRIPPAWTNVRVSTDPNAALVVQGTDSKGRRQSVYSETHTTKKAAAKFSKIRELLSKHAGVLSENIGNLKSKDKSVRESAHAMLLVQSMGLRPGSERDTGAEKQAYGATTLRAEHVVVNQDGSVNLKFTGKKGVALNLPVTEEPVRKILVERKAKKGKLFDVSDSELRDYASSLDGGKFRPKDFRTAKGTNVAIEAIKTISSPKTMSEYKRAVKQVATRVSAVLGNTPAIALQSYIDPSVFSGWRM